MEEKQPMCLVKTGGLIGLMMTRAEGKYLIHGFESETDGIRYFEDAYNRNHSRSYEASMSACLNRIFFQPSIVRLSIDEVRPIIEGDGVVTAINTSGGMVLLPLLKKQAETLWNSGVKPRLI